MGSSLAFAGSWAWLPEVAVSHDDDVALLRAVTRGDLRAQTDLVRRLMPPLRAVARAILGADADDGVQVALLRVLERASTYRGEASIESWARTVGVRACLRLSLSQRRHRPVDEPIEEQLAAPGTDDELLVDELPGPITGYVERLPASQREALILRHALGYSVAEVAELLSIPIDTAKSRLMYGLRALRKAIRRDQVVGPRAGAIGGRGG